MEHKNRKSPGGRDLWMCPKVQFTVIFLTTHLENQVCMYICACVCWWFSSLPFVHALFYFLGRPSNKSLHEIKILPKLFSVPYLIRDWTRLEPFGNKMAELKKWKAVSLFSLGMSLTPFTAPKFLCKNSIWDTKGKADVLVNASCQGLVQDQGRYKNRGLGADVSKVSGCRQQRVGPPELGVCSLRQSSQELSVEDLPDHSLPEVWHVLLQGHRDTLNFQLSRPNIPFPTLLFFSRFSTNIVSMVYPVFQNC